MSTSTTSSANKEDGYSAADSASPSETILTASTFCDPSEPVEIDTSTLSAEDLQSLKKDDPFLYYSIPAVRRANFTTAGKPDLSSSSGEPSNTIVKRSTRVSFECHVDLALEGLLEELEVDSNHQVDMSRVDAEIFKLFGLTELSKQWESDFWV